jgi:hypothetical protein
MPPQPGYPRPPPKKSRRGLYIGLGVLAVAGISVGAWATSRSKKADPWDAPTDPTPVTPDDPPSKPDDPPVTRDDPPVKPVDPPPLPPNPGPMSQMPNFGTATVPRGTRLIPPQDFVEAMPPGPVGHMIVSQKLGGMVMIGALPANVDKSMFIQLMKRAGLTYEGQTQLESAGGTRDAIGFHNFLNGVKMSYLVVFYQSHVLAVAALPDVVTNQPGMAQRIREFWAHNVIVP